jgi:hypothetical protein
MPAQTVTESIAGAPGEGEAPTQYQTQTPGGFDTSKFLKAYMAEPDSDPLQAIELEAKLAKNQGWKMVGNAPGGGQLWLGPTGEPKVIGSQDVRWVVEK